MEIQKYKLKITNSPIHKHKFNRVHVFEVILSKAKMCYLLVRCCTSLPKFKYTSTNCKHKNVKYTDTYVFEAPPLSKFRQRKKEEKVPSVSPKCDPFCH